MVRYIREENTSHDLVPTRSIPASAAGDLRGRGKEGRVKYKKVVNFRVYHMICTAG